MQMLVAIVWGGMENVHSETIVWHFIRVFGFGMIIVSPNWNVTYILKSLFAVRTPHTVFTYVFMLLCYECTLMPSRCYLKYMDWTVHLYVFQHKKVNIGGFIVKC